MTRMLRAAVLAIAILAVLGGLIGGARDAAAANGYEQLILSSTDGCAYYWDGYAYTAVLCPRLDGWVDVYVVSVGQWVYVATVRWEGFGDYSAVLADGTYVSHYGSGYEFYTYPDGTTGSNMTDAQIQILTIISEANNRGLAIVAAPDCTYSSNGCF